jgi:segregation and condensation protein B
MDDRTPPEANSSEAEELPPSDRPFKVVVEPQTSGSGRGGSDFSTDTPPAPDDFDPFGADGLGVDDIEAAYRRAFEAMDRAWQDAGPILGKPGSETTVSELFGSDAPGDEVDRSASLRIDAAHPAASDDASIDEKPADQQAAKLAGVPAPPEVRGAPAEVTVLRALEALLFVGGVTLTPQRISAVLGLTGESRSVGDLVDELNQRFATDGRPYEVQFSQGGYHLELRPEYERLRRKVYGIGPREVKLTQESLEILALVAYRQPLTGDDLERCGKGQAAGLLRQLIRRDLVAVERFAREDGSKDVRYTTTSRFLDLFGLGNLRDLPQPEDLAVK